jgi:DUF1680 family protein
VPGYAYGTRGNELFVNLFVAGTAEFELDGGKVRVTQETNYPWDGLVKIKVDQSQVGFTGRGGRPVPSAAVQTIARRACFGT